MFAVVITGCSWSVTFTVCAAVEVFPWMSVTVQVIVVVPTGKNECDACDVVIAPQLPKLSTEKSTILPETAP